MTSKFMLFFSSTSKDKEKSKYSFLPIFCITILVASISLPLITILESQFSYAQTPLALKTLDVKAKFDKKVIKLGDSQKVHLSVEDKQTAHPISGALVKVALTYSGAKKIRELTFITDKQGDVDFTLPISKRDFSGTYAVDMAITMTGYTDASFGISFAAIDSYVHDIKKCSHGHHHDCFD